MSNLEWTTAAPRQAGWYWRRVVPAPRAPIEREPFGLDILVTSLVEDLNLPKHVEIVRVWLQRSRGTGCVTPAVRYSPGFRDMVYGDAVEWAGPIPEPGPATISIVVANDGRGPLPAGEGL